MVEARNADRKFDALDLMAGLPVDLYSEGEQSKSFE